MSYAIVTYVIDDPDNAGYPYAEGFSTCSQDGDGVNAGAYVGADSRQITDLIECTFPENHEFRRKVKVREATIGGEKAAMWQLPSDEFLMRGSRSEWGPNTAMSYAFFDGLLSLKYSSAYVRIVYWRSDDPGYWRRDEDVKVAALPKSKAITNRPPYTEPVADIPKDATLRPYPTCLLKQGIPERVGVKVCPDVPGMLDFIDALGVKEIVV